VPHRDPRPAETRARASLSKGCAPTSSTRSSPASSASSSRSSAAAARHRDRRDTETPRPSRDPARRLAAADPTPRGYPGETAWMLVPLPPKLFQFSSLKHFVGGFEVNHRVLRHWKLVFTVQTPLQTYQIADKKCLETQHLRHDTKSRYIRRRKTKRPNDAQKICWMSRPATPEQPPGARHRCPHQ
jgi:hypothetical protein